MIIEGRNFTIGADPEFWVAKDKKVVSAHGMIQGDKANPQKVENGAVQVDGTALEFNIDPASTVEEFTNNIDSVLSSLRKMIPEDYSFQFYSANEYSEEDFENIPPYALALGCSPDYNAYTGKLNKTPNSKTRLRTASGHIHIGWTDEPVNPLDGGHMAACIELTKMLDLYLGVPLSLLDIELEGEDTRRRTMYGRAGDFRPKPYGMEYRVPSPRWVEHKEAQEFVFRNTVRAIQRCFDAGYQGIICHVDEDITKPINSLNKDSLEHIARYYSTGTVDIRKECRPPKISNYNPFDESISSTSTYTTYLSKEDFQRFVWMDNHVR